VNLENWEFAPCWLDVDTDAYGVVVVLGYDFAVVVVAVFVVSGYNIIIAVIFNICIVVVVLSSSCSSYSGSRDV
jgi:hypothetical protein